MRCRDVEDGRGFFRTTSLTAKRARVAVSSGRILTHLLPRARLGPEATSSTDRDSSSIDSGDDPRPKRDDLSARASPRRTSSAWATSPETELAARHVRLRMETARTSVTC